jgi:3',5'-cyclic AMP phosphodiesterase CpdA
MPAHAIYLHITDAHIAAAGTALLRDDLKVAVPGIAQSSRENSLELLFARLAQTLTAEGRQLDGVFFSGDAQDRGRSGGHELLLQMILRHFGPLGITPAKIVAVPGNHDVPRRSAPGSAERYEAFIETWRSVGCVTPWLDGIDKTPRPAAAGAIHRLLSADNRLAVFPINSSNWSHVSAILPEPLRDVWTEIPKLAAPGDAAKEAALRSQLDALATYDMARVSPDQLEALRAIIAGTPQPPDGNQLRLAVIHHHLRAPSLREELKPFADISNLEQLRSFLRDHGISVIIHGHKHEHAAQFEHIYDHLGERHHKALVISGATFGVGAESDAVRLISIVGLPATPTIRIEPIGLPRAGVESPRAEAIVRRLWPSADALPGEPVVVTGTDIDEVYARACAAASKEADRGILIVHLDLPGDEADKLPLPSDYPVPEPANAGEKDVWMRELVHWWQLDRSQLDHRIPYIHGGRLRRFGGKINQVERIIRLLRQGSTTRALAVLIDPFRDFVSEGREEFASFCLVEFKLRKIAPESTVIDCIAFYRAQEFAQWWPINVAELRSLQREIGRDLAVAPGRITTIAADARTISKSPTQVAMPVIDRWLDQAPQRLYLLAGALARRSARPGLQEQTVRDWRRCLTDLHQAATKFNPDGMPVAIEGLQRLASYLEVAEEEGDELEIMAQTLRNLATSNLSYERSTRDATSFDAWSPVAIQLIESLQAMTVKRLGEP